MSVKSVLQELNERIAKQTAVKTFLLNHQLAIEANGVEDFLDLWGFSSLDFNNLDRPQTVKALEIFGGKWQKAPTEDGRVNYTQEIGDVTVRLWAAAPPASCKLVEYEEVIPEKVVPEQRIKRYKLDCAPEEKI